MTKEAKLGLFKAIARLFRGFSSAPKAEIENLVRRGLLTAEQAAAIS